LAHDLGLALRGLGLPLRRFDLTIGRFLGGANCPPTGKKRQEPGGNGLPMVKNAQRVPE
jgi:hypothetical protein